MKLDKLDFAVFLIVVICLAGVALAAVLNDPARQPARVAYLYPATASQQNVWMADVNNPGEHEQLTFSDYGVYDFDFSSDGRRLVYADRSGTGTVTLRLLDYAKPPDQSTWSIVSRWRLIVRRRSSVPMDASSLTNAPNQPDPVTACHASGWSI